MQPLPPPAPAPGYQPPPPPRRVPKRAIAGVGCGGLVVIFALLWTIGTVAGPPPEEPTKPVAASATPTTSAPKPPPPPSATATPAATPEPRPSTPTPTPAKRERPAPTPAQAEAYLTYIGKVDPGLVVNRERALRRADYVCERIVNPPQGSNVTLVDYTVHVLSGGNATIDKGQARRIIQAVKVWCR